MPARRVSTFLLGLALVAAPAAAEVQLTINGGRVSLSAKNATVSQILAEWARVGQTRIVNGERVPGGPVSLQLTDVSEVEAIEILLRSAGGYLLAPRHADVANASQYDRILILPTSSPQRPAVAAPAPTPGPIVRPPQFAPLPPQNDDNDDQAPRPNPQPDSRPPVFNTFPQPPVRTAPPPVSVPTTTSPGVPAGVSTPGMIVPAPTPQPGQPVPTAPPQ